MQDRSIALMENEKLKEFENFLKEYLKPRNQEIKDIDFSDQGLTQLIESMEYTLFSPCKRFRPLLVLGYLEFLNIDYKKGFPLAAAIELIHTGSLIHDDLPVMDDDSQRRENPCNHLIYGEDVALLSGNSLYIEAFCLLIYFKQDLNIMGCVAKAASCSAMMGGQSLDLKAKSCASLKFIQKIHQLKTGALIHACLQGVFYLNTQISEEKKKVLEYYSKTLCEVFQIVDDLQDKNKKESSNILNTITEKKALMCLKTKSQECLDKLEVFCNQNSILKDLILFNVSRSSSFL